MAAGGDVEVKSLLLKVDASVELLRKNLGEAGQTLDTFTQKGEASAARFDSSLKRTGVSAGQMQFAMRDLSAQIGDVATSFSSGTPILQIFAQQSNQVVGALQLMTAETKGFLGVLAGPWGAILSAAVLVISKFALGNKDATQAEKEHKTAADLLADSINALEKATKGAIDSGQRELFLRQAQTRADLDATLQKRKLIDATIDQAAAELGRRKSELAVQQTLSQAPGQRGEVSSLGLEVKSGAVAAVDQQIAALQVQRSQNEAAATRASANVRRADAAVTQQLVKEAYDPAARAAGHFERAVDLLNRKFEQGRITAAAYQEQYGRLTRQHEDATAKVDHHRAAHVRLSEAEKEAAKEAKVLQKALEDLPGATQDAFKEIDKAFLEGGQKAVDQHTKQFYGALGVDPEKDFKGIVKQIDDEKGLKIAAQEEASHKDFQQRAEQIRTLAGLYQDAFTGGTKAIFRDFKQIGLQVIAELLAKFAIAKLSGQAFNFGSAFSSSVSSALPGFANGGSPAVGKLSIVGERGPELFVPSVPGTIIPNGRGLGNSVSLVVNAPGATAETVSMIRRELANAAPAFIDAARRSTVSSLQRPRL